ncbi:MAG TPA: efflux RND transporter periplasmic adaptor subunit [Vicinamibacterales bacterium]|nr:efflux RND transporter periplasmic adaptor subunit [Vicinamibacterales bacterium]
MTPRLLLFLAVFGAACSSPSTNEEPKAAPARPVTEVTLNADQIAHGGVRWSAVASSPVADFVELPGRLVLDEDHTARLSVSVRGRVTDVRANLGDAVSRRQALVVLQSEEASARRADLAKATAEAAERDSALRYARSARERAERLLALKAGSAQDLERARADEAAAEASAAQARASVDHARTALSVLEVDDTGQIQLAAPISGVVVARDVVVGSVVEAGASALVVADLEYLWLEFGAPDTVAGLLKPGQRLHFVVPPSTETIEARVLRVNGAIDPTTRLVTVRAAVANPTKRLRPEMFVTVRADTAPSRPGVLVPHDAVQLLDERPVVFVAQPDGKGGAKFVRRDVQTGTTVEGRTHIVSGLTPGDVVVTEGAFAVKSQFSRGKMPAGG